MMTQQSRNIGNGYVRSGGSGMANEMACEFRLKSLSLEREVLDDSRLSMETDSKTAWLNNKANRITKRVSSFSIGLTRRPKHADASRDPSAANVSPRNAPQDFSLHSSHLIGPSWVSVGQLDGMSQLNSGRDVDWESVNAQPVQPSRRNEIDNQDQRNFSNGYQSQVIDNLISYDGPRSLSLSQGHLRSHSFRAQAHADEVVIDDRDADSVFCNRPQDHRRNNASEQALSSQPSFLSTSFRSNGVIETRQASAVRNYSFTGGQEESQTGDAVRISGRTSSWAGNNIISPTELHRSSFYDNDEVLSPNTARKYFDEAAHRNNRGRGYAGIPRQDCARQLVSEGKIRVSQCQRDFYNNNIEQRLSSGVYSSPDQIDSPLGQPDNNSGCGGNPGSRTTCNTSNDSMSPLPPPLPLTSPPYGSSLQTSFGSSSEGYSPTSQYVAPDGGASGNIMISTPADGDTYVNDNIPIITGRPPISKHSMPTSRNFAVVPKYRLSSYENVCQQINTSPDFITPERNYSANGATRIAYQQRIGSAQENMSRDGGSGGIVKPRSSRESPSPAIRNECEIKANSASSQSNMLRKLSQEFYGNARYGASRQVSRDFVDRQQLSSINESSQLQTVSLRIPTSGSANSIASTSNQRLSLQEGQAVKNRDDESPPADGSNFVRHNKVQMSLRKAFGIFEEFDNMERQQRMTEISQTESQPDGSTSQSADSTSQSPAGRIMNPLKGRQSMDNINNHSAPTRLKVTSSYAETRSNGSIVNASPRKAVSLPRGIQAPFEQFSDSSQIVGSTSSTSLLSARSAGSQSRSSSSRTTDDSNLLNSSSYSNKSDNSSSPCFTANSEHSPYRRSLFVQHPNNAESRIVAQHRAHDDHSPPPPSLPPRRYRAIESCDDLASSAPSISIVVTANDDYDCTLKADRYADQLRKQSRRLSRSSTATAAVTPRLGAGGYACGTMYQGTSETTEVTGSPAVCIPPVTTCVSNSYMHHAVVNVLEHQNSDPALGKVQSSNLKGVLDQRLFSTTSANSLEIHTSRSAASVIESSSKISSDSSAPFHTSSACLLVTPVAPNTPNQTVDSVTCDETAVSGKSQVTVKLVISRSPKSVKQSTIISTNSPTRPNVPVPSSPLSESQAEPTISTPSTSAKSDEFMNDGSPKLMDGVESRSNRRHRPLSKSPKRRTGRSPKNTQSSCPSSELNGTSEATDNIDVDLALPKKESSLIVKSRPGVSIKLDRSPPAAGELKRKVDTAVVAPNIRPTRDVTTATTTAVVSGPGVNSTDSPRKNICHVRKKSLEEVEYDRQAAVVVGQLEENERHLCRVILPPPQHKMAAGYMTRIFDTVLVPGSDPLQRRRRGDLDSQEESMQQGLAHEVAHHAEESAVALEEGNSNDNISDSTREASLESDKLDLIARIDKKLKILRREQQNIQRDILDNNARGKQLSALVEQKLQTRELEKYRLYVDELDKVLYLLLRLSDRLAKAENAIYSLPQNASDKEKATLISKRDDLLSKHADAIQLKTGIDRRSGQVRACLQEVIDEEDLKDYDYFIHMKTLLVVEQQEIDGMIALGLDQQRLLKGSMCTS